VSDDDGDPASGDRAAGGDDGDDEDVPDRTDDGVPSVRRARADDHDAVVAFTADTWADRGTSDYVPEVYREWVADDGPRQRTFVLDARDPGRHGETANPGDVAGVVQAVMLSPSEAWLRGMRIHPECRRRGLGTRLTHAAFGWARDRGAAVARNMVHSWNAKSLGLSRTAGFATGVELRWARPDPDPDATPGRSVVADADAGWAFWTASAARTRLRGLALDGAEPWALSELRRERLRAAAEAGGLFVVRDGGTRGLAFHNRTYTFDREAEPSTPSPRGPTRTRRRHCWRPSRATPPARAPTRRASPSRRASGGWATPPLRASPSPTNPSSSWRRT
jgi:GNAT superfamily N-acetyltransferase